MDKKKIIEEISNSINAYEKTINVDCLTNVGKSYQEGIVFGHKQCLILVEKFEEPQEYEMICTEISQKEYPFDYDKYECCVEWECPCCHKSWLGCKKLYVNFCSNCGAKIIHSI